MFQDLLKELRTGKKLSQAKLAKEIGVSPGNIGDWESGRSKPGYDALISLSKYFNVSSDYLLFGASNCIEIDPNEETLVRRYRRLSDSSKVEVLNFIKFRLQSEQSDDFMASSAYPNGNGSTGGSSGQNLA